MDNLPRLELREEKSNLKNNEFIVFRYQSKGKDKGKGKSLKNSKNYTYKKGENNKIKSFKKTTNKKNRKGRKSRKNKKSIFNIFLN